MTDWTAGYVADIAYTYGYYNELNPLHARLAFLASGLPFPEVGTACELGFGQGLSTNVHAAATVIEWHGTDFNPSQAAFARELAQASGANVRLVDDAFADFCNRPDLPDFDYIALHGIWSWISDENRTIIVDFIRRKLKVGGVVYISYNTQPGWASFAPMRHLLNQHADIIGAEGHGITRRIDGALDFAQRLIDANALYTRANPGVAERIALIKSQPREYLAHEYFNRDWHPMHFATMAEWLEGAKLSFACSAALLDHVPNVTLTAEQQALLADIPDPMFRESVRDFLVNAQFRRDLWVKGPRTLSVLERHEALRQLRVLLVTPRARVGLSFKTLIGDVELAEAVYTPILDLLANHEPRTLAQLELGIEGRGINFDQLAQAILLLVHLGHVNLAQPDDAIARARPATERLNAFIRAKARSTGDILTLASPVTGGGYAVPRFAQLFLTALASGLTEPNEWASHAWAILDSQKQRLLVDGQTLATEEANLAELYRSAEEFGTLMLPILRALGIA